MIAPKLFEQGSPNRTPPIVLEMIEPIRCLDERRTLTGRSIGNANTVGSRAKMNFLFHLVGTNARPFRLHRSSNGSRSDPVLFRLGSRTRSLRVQYLLGRATADISYPRCYYLFRFIH